MNTIRSSLIKLARWPLRFSSPEALLRKLTTGKRYGSFVSRLPPKHVHYDVPSTRLARINGIVFKLDLSDLVGWYVYWGFTDPSRNRLYSLISTSDTILDIGANIGEVSLNSAKLINASGRVFAFEPFPKSFSRLQENLDLNEVTNVRALNLALGAEQGVLQMVTPEGGNAGMNRIANASTSDTTVEVKVETLDGFVSEQAINRIDLIKIDVEGYEHNVLRGGIESIQRFKPKLFIEVVDAYLRDQGSSAKELIELLDSLGYHLRHAATGERFGPSKIPKDFQFDVIALPGGNEHG